MGLTKSNDHGSLILGMANTDLKSRPDRPTLDQRAIGLRIIESRNLQRWQQRELALRAGLLPSRLSKLERGLGRPKVEECLQIAWAFGMGLEELILGRSAGEADAATQEEPAHEAVAELFRLLKPFVLSCCVAAKLNLEKTQRC